MNSRKVLWTGIALAGSLAISACGQVAPQQLAREQPGVLRSWQHVDVKGYNEEEQAKKGTVPRSPASLQKELYMEREHTGRD
ncbi:MAG: hypothetical protein HY695_02695 [Deltaproteobacteria bacterium]|nr:hypothetical protein [Deltaproteobacteria bacterium]